MTKPVWLLRAEEARARYETRLLELPIVTEGAQGPYQPAEFDRFCKQTGRGIIALFAQFLTKLSSRAEEGSELQTYLDRNRRQEEIHFRAWCKMAKEDAGIEPDVFPHVVLSPEMIRLGTHVLWLAEEGPISLSMASIFLSIEPLAFRMTESVAITQSKFLKAQYWMRVHTRSKNEQFGRHYEDACRFIDHYVGREGTAGSVAGTVIRTAELLESALASAYRASQITSNSGG